ncbi:MAG: FCD domain-containing protein [Syntrophomonadaceae bacterium]|nr:FCD domain-containing protein [Syntrophomonadaceae bacterium]
MTPEKTGELEVILEKIKNYDIEKDYTKIIIQDQNFHKIIFESAANPCLTDILHGLQMHTERMWIYAKPEIGEINLFLNTMPNIVKALKSGNGEQASKYAKNHTDIFVERIKQEFF